MQVVVAVLRDRLLGHGDVLRHLASRGYKLAHVQDPRDEMDLTVSALAVDLRSGLRLCRLMECLTGESHATQAYAHSPDFCIPQQSNAVIAVNCIGSIATSKGARIRHTLSVHDNVYK